MSVVRGNATANANGSRLKITVSDNAFLNWNSFNIARGETTTFFQPSSSSVIFNRISEAGPSQIWGNLNANGTVILANSHGFYFGPGSMIQVGGSFVATTAPLTPDFGGSSTWQFTGMPPLANIVNYGQIESHGGGSLFLIAEHVENHGELKSLGGTIGLYAGKEVLVSLRPDGRGLSAAVTLPSGSVDNSGRLIADGGDIALRAQVVNQNGIIQADSVRERNGVIELVASDSLTLGNDSQILARGDNESRVSAGGKITLKSDGPFQDFAQSQIITIGGRNGGNGGDVEVSAQNFLSLDSTMDARAQSGFSGGKLLLDPLDIILGTSGSGSAGNGTIPANTPGTLALSVNTAFLNKNFSEITLQATRNISLAAGTVWDLSASTGLTDGRLTLQSGNNITFESNARIVDANNWSVRLDAGMDFNSGQVRSGIGSVFLNGGAGKSLSGAIETAHGNIDIAAGDSVLVGIGYVRTVAGGNIHAHALAGDVDAGKKNDGYEFTTTGYRISLAGLGGIATAHGGDVTLEAGRDVISIPTVGNSQPPGASGAYGSEHGDVTINAGHQVLGNFLARNGIGTIQAGVTVENGHVTQILNPNASIGTATRAVSLSLVSGSWNAWSASDIFLSEVRDPNGTFNRNKVPVPAGAFPGNIDDVIVPDRIAFLFDYAPDASVNLWANNGITLLGANLPRVTGQNQNMPAIYAPRLSLDAGAGGIEIRNNLILYPSAQGALSITTRDGGKLFGRQQAASLTGIVMSDSGLPEWNTFAQGHAIAPLHLHDPNLVRLDISGSVENFGLTVPTAASIDIAGDTYNFGFLGQNLSREAVTSIHVGGDIRYRGNLTDVMLGEALPAGLLNPAVSTSPGIAVRLRYDATTQKLTFVGQMTDAELSFLINPSVLVFDRFGNPALDPNGVQKSEPVTLTSAQHDAIRQLYADSQSASLGDNGLALSGPGHFNVSARNVDLGISGGITVTAPNAALAAITPYGSQLDIALGGNLDMTSSKIANESYLGGITLTAGGRIDIGSQLTTFGDPDSPKGIFTSSGGSIDVLASGDVNVNGSRIATYTGGNIAVKSLHGDVNAGAGGSGYVSVNALELDPETGKLRAVNGTIPGSGIFATTLKLSTAQVGDIFVDAPEGSIRASAGGIVQVAYNGRGIGGVIDLNAGENIDAGGSGVIGGNIHLKAGGDIKGVVIGSESIDINSQHDVSVTAFSAGSVSINAAGTVAGTVIGGSGVSVSGDSITASLISKNISASGDTSGATVGVPASDAPKAETKLDDDATATAKATKGDSLEEDNLTKKKKAALAKLTGRVTVILPAGRN